MDYIFCVQLWDSEKDFPSTHLRELRAYALQKKDNVLDSWFCQGENEREAYIYHIYFFKTSCKQSVSPIVCSLVACRWLSFNYW